MKSKSLLALSFALMTALALVACSTGSGSSASPSASGASAGSAASSTASESSSEAVAQALSGKGLATSFVGENVTDAIVTKEEEAVKVANSLVERMGGDGTTSLDLVDVISTETGTTYYIFRQEAGGIIVHGASAKLIVDKDGKVAGLVSAILPDVKLPSSETTAVSQEQAEKVVVESLAEDGMSGAKVESEYTYQTIIPLADDEKRYRLAWVAFVKSAPSDSDDQAWLANYVSIDGEYLYNMPVSEPDGADAIAGVSNHFDFNAYDQQEKTFDIVKGGETKQVSVPVLVNKESGKVALLGDAKRQIICADYTEATENDTLVSPVEGDDESYNDKDIAVYENFIRVYDFFESMGWRGPNGEGTPSLLLMNYMQDGAPAENCAYIGRGGGWEVFAFGRAKDYGLATDVIAHEFTHCVTSTTMTTNLYANEPGAINEGMSDILGNIAEMALDGDEGAWTIGEKAGGDKWRSMSDPTTDYQPEYRWGIYYEPDAPETTSMNDNGGVHGNSSLLNIVSYKLGKAGMSVEDQAYFWMNVALAMVPTTDFAKMAELLPWVLKQSGYSQYEDALKRAIDEAGYVKLEKPAELPAGAGEVKLVYPDAESAEQGKVRVVFYGEDEVKAGSSDIWAWPVAQSALASATLPAGDYYVVTMVGSNPSTSQDKIFADGGWVAFNVSEDELADKGTVVHVEPGKSIELSTSGLV